MKILLNGKEIHYPGKSSLPDFVLSCGYTPERVVVQHNGRILTRDEWDGVTVRESDRIDVLQFVGGG